MTLATDIPILLVADSDIHRAKVWRDIRHAQFHAYGRQDFSIQDHLSPDIPVLLYQTDTRLADTLRFLNQVSQRQSDLCVILLGKDIGADPVARLLRHGAFDYLTWPCPAARLSESIASGLANRRTFLEVRNLSDELARTNLALAQDRVVLTQCNRNLSGLNQLTQALAGSLEPESVIKALFSELPQLIAADLIGLVRTSPEQVWTWSQSQEHQREETVRAQLLGRLGLTRHRTTASHTTLRLVRPVHLTLVPATGKSLPDQENHSVYSHDVPLAIGPHGVGMLHIERKHTGPFTEQEQQLLATVGASLSLTLRNAETHQEIQDLALRDPLTGLLNRRALDGPLTREYKAGPRYGTPACLLLLDLDYFKTVNDLLGHVAGDDVLRGVAALIRDTVRDVDSAGRYGGEEFAVVLPHTDLNQAQALAERIRVIIERHAFELEDGHVRITASIGLAALHNARIATVGDWIAAADSALYEAKSRGRNCVVTHTPGNLAPAQTAVLCIAA